MRLPRPAVGLLVLCAKFVSPCAVVAQEPPKIQAGGGYLHIVDPWAAFNSPVTPDFGHGWFAKVAGNATPHVGALGEVSGSYYGAYGHKGVRGSASIHGVMGGVMVHPLCCPRVAPFAQVLGGLVHSRFRDEEPQTSTFDVTERRFAVALGGGVDVRGVHVAADFMRVRHHELYSAWSWRIAAGIMLPGR